MRAFSLRNPDIDVPSAADYVANWTGLDAEIAQQLAFEQQYLEFDRHLLANLQSVPSLHPHYAPLQLDLSLRGGAIKSHVVFACAVIEGALAAYGEKIGLAAPGRLLRQPLGGVMTEWSPGGTPRAEVAPIWRQLELLKRYRNFIHLGKAAASPDAYWRNLLAEEANLLEAIDICIAHLVVLCRVP